MRLRPVSVKVGHDPCRLPQDCRISPGSRFVAPARIVKSLTTLLTAVVALFSCSFTCGDQLHEIAEKVGIRILAEGDSSADIQKRSGAAIPLRQLTAENRLRARKILEDCTQYRRLPSLQYTIDEPVYRYLLQHPDVAVSTWRVMGISRFEMWQTGPQDFEAQAIDGSEGLVDILYQDQNQMLFICDGNYHHALLPKPLEASALVWFRMAFTPNAEGTQVVIQKADVFVRFPSAGVSAVAKMLTPVTNSMMDRNLFEVSLYGSMMSRAVRDEPEWVIQVAEQMEGVLPQRKGELITVAREPRQSTSRRSVQRDTAGTVDRNIIMSPQLLFFDPPKVGTTIAGETSVLPGTPVTVSSGNTRTASPPSATPVSSSAVLSIIPAAKTSPSSPDVLQTGAQKEKPGMQSDDEFKLQPVVPPVGPTATGPAGSGPAASANR